MEKNWKVESERDRSLKDTLDKKPNEEVHAEQAAPNPDVKLDEKPLLKIKIVDTTMTKDVLKDVMKITNESKKSSKDKAEMAETIKKQL